MVRINLDYLPLNNIETSKQTHDSIYSDSNSSNRWTHAVTDGICVSTDPGSHGGSLLCPKNSIATLLLLLLIGHRDL
jgi:NAD kinase